MPSRASIFPVENGAMIIGKGQLFLGDNLRIMQQLPGDSIDLIYIDPPYFSGNDYSMKDGTPAFSDRWANISDYLTWLNARLHEMRRLLKSTGSIYVHCDWHAGHYIKVEMDGIFGVDGFRNEIVWCYTGPGSPGMKQFSRKHDTIFWYTKGNRWQFNDHDIRIPYNEKTLANFKSGLKGSGYTAGRELDMRGKIPEDWWKMAIAGRYPVDGIKRAGYPTEKPWPLLQRIILTSSSLGDVVADFFCGGGTTPAVAQSLNRHWIACDQSYIAVTVTANRMMKIIEKM